MCFTKEFSLFNFLLLTGYGATVMYQNWGIDNNSYKLYIPLYYLGIKDLLQTFLYVYQNNEKYQFFLSVLSYIHICFQPVFVNFVFSYFSPNTTYFGINYWAVIFIATMLFGIYRLTNLDVFDIFKEAPYCKEKESDFCNDKNTSYMGKYHIGYKFRTKYKYDNWFLFWMLIPALFTNSYIVSLIFAFVTLLIKLTFMDVRDGELGAIWCLLSIIPTLPLIYFRQPIIDWISKHKV